MKNQMENGMESGIKLIIYIGSCVLGVRPKEDSASFLGGHLYLEGQGDLVSKVVMGISGLRWVTGAINLPTESSWPSK